MNKPFSLILGVVALTVTLTAHGQDTAKKYQKPASPTQVKAPTTTPATNPYKQPAAYRTAPATVAPAAAVPITPAVVDHSLAGQYNAILKSTYRYQQGPIASFYKNYMDTLNVEKRKLKDAQTKLAVQAKTISALQGDVSSKDQTLSESQSKVDSVSFLGIALSKAMYNIIMWGLVLVLGAGLVAVIYLSASSRREAAYRIKLFDELSAEFQTYKTKANEKEKKLARELQTERNKLDELTGK